MPDAAGMRFFVVGRDAVFAHPVRHGLFQPFGAFRLELAAVRRNDLVRARTVKARNCAALLLRDRELHLIAVAVLYGRARDLQLRDAEPADALERVADAPALEAQLLVVIHVPEIAAAAAAEIRAVRLHAVRRRLRERLQYAVCRRFSDIYNADHAFFTRDHAGNENDLTVDARHALAVRGVAGDLDGIPFVELQHIPPLFHMKHSLEFSLRLFYHRPTKL